MFLSLRPGWRRATLMMASMLLVGRVQVHAQVPAKQWDRTFGGSAMDAIYAVHQTSDGGYILGGSSDSGSSGDKTQAGQGAIDYWVVKLDARGNKVWDRTLGGSGDDYLRALQPTPDGGYLVGGFTNSGVSGDKTQASRGDLDYWLVKLDASGTKQWDKSFGGDGPEHMACLLPTNDGGCLLGGDSSSGLNGDKTQATLGAGDYWIIKLDVNGNKQWDKRFGSHGEEALTVMQPTRDGGYLLGGLSTGNISGDKTQASRGGADYWIIKVDATGSTQWDKTFGGASSDVLSALQATRDGGYLLGGSSYSGIGSDKTQAKKSASYSTDYWVVKLDANGAKQWDTTVGGNDQDVLNALSPTSDGGYLLGGYSYSGLNGDKSEASLGDSDYWLVKLDTGGNKLWDRTFGGSGRDEMLSLQATRAGDCLLGGTSNSGISGGKTQPSHGGDDYWIIKLSGTTTARTNSAPARPFLRVYPNPARTYLTLHLPQEAPGTDLHLSLLDATGHTVWAQPLSATGAGVPVEVGQHPAGLYLVRVEGPAGFVATQRVVLE